MKLVLASSPFKNKKIIKKIVELTGKKKKEISVAMITEAGYGEDLCLAKYIARGINRITQNFGGEVFILNLHAHSLDKIITQIESADVIFATGGSTDFLMQSLACCGLDKRLPKILETKVWVGSSAGSCVMFHRNTEEEDKKFYPVEKYYDVKKHMAIVNAFMYPHFWSDYTLENAEQNLILASKNYSLPVYALSDKSAVIVEGEKEYLFGKNAIKLFKGEIIEKV